jgi:hypothetical protein
MSHKRTLQIDVIGPIAGSKGIVGCKLYFDGKCLSFCISDIMYEELMKDGFFVRNGKERDSANVLNTSNVFVEQ